jgi:hypothetical protein
MKESVGISAIGRDVYASSDVSVAEEAQAEDKNVTVNVKAKRNIFKKIFMPWKWKSKKKSDKLKARCSVLERKLSVRRSRKQLARLGAALPDEVEEQPVAEAAADWVERVGPLPPPAMFAEPAAGVAEVVVAVAGVAELVARLEGGAANPVVVMPEEEGAWDRCLEMEAIGRQLERQLSLRPAPEELAACAVLPCRARQEDRRRVGSSDRSHALQVSARLERRLSGRPSAGELRDRNILRRPEAEARGARC